MSSWLSSLELVGVLRRTVELGPARGELKGGGSGERRPGHGSAAAHEEGRSSWITSWLEVLLARIQTPIEPAGEATRRGRVVGWLTWW